MCDYLKMMGAVSCPSSSPLVMRATWRTAVGTLAVLSAAVGARRRARAGEVIPAMHSYSSVVAIPLRSEFAIEDMLEHVTEMHVTERVTAAVAWIARRAFNSPSLAAASLFLSPWTKVARQMSLLVPLPSILSCTLPGI